MTHGREKSIEAKVRLKKILAMRKSGISYREIGEELGVSASYACAEVRRALIENPLENTNDYRLLELERLDSMQQKVESAIRHGDIYPDKGYKLLLDIGDRRAKLLGLNAPERLEIASQGEPIDMLREIMRRAFLNPQLKQLIMDWVANANKVSVEIEAKQIDE